MLDNPHYAHVGVASINQTVGDWSGNASRIRAVIADARARGVRLLTLPELCIPGYSLGDRLVMRGTLQRSWKMLESLRDATGGMVVCVGLPVRHDGVLYNAVAVLADTKIVGLVCKEYLATGDVQYENRWYQGWNFGRVESFTTPDGGEVPIGTLVFDAAGIGAFAVEVCEDGWKGLRPGSRYALAGATVIVNPSASWFTIGKHRVRRDMVRQISREDHVVYLYSSLLGCDATRLIFDGSVFIADNGDVAQEGRRFLFDQDHELIDRVVDIESLMHARVEEGSWRQQVDGLHRGDFGPQPTVIRLDGDFSTDRTPPAPSPYWLAGTVAEPVDASLLWLHPAGLIAQQPTAVDLPYLELELALSLGLAEYRRKTGIPKFTLALSGGRDSSMVALLVARGVRYSHVDATAEDVHKRVGDIFTTAYMATELSGSATRNAAKGLAAELGAKHLEVGIQRAFDLHVTLNEELTGTALSWDEPSHDITLQNVQARLRGSLIWMVANQENGLLLSTSNKSEAAVGYATMDGDTSGGLSPIADVPKSMVTAYLMWAARFHGLKSIESVVATPAMAELRPTEHAQTDEGDLMPFAVLDQLMFLFVQKGQGPVEMFRTLWPSLSERYSGCPTAFSAHIHKFVRLLCRAQWKRERFAITFRVTAFDLDPKTGFRFPPVQAPFTEELAELDEYVANLS